MDETIHINIGSLIKTDTHYISTTKTRLWPSLIAGLRWIYKRPIGGSTLTVNGLGLLTINTLAIAVEGFITDILIEYLTSDNQANSDRITQIENSSWSSKVKAYSKEFQNPLSNCKTFKAIEILLLLRNNTAHGRTHTEQTIRSIDGKETSKIESQNKNYEKVRKFFIAQKLMKESEMFSNVETLWQIAHAQFFMGYVRLFMYEVLENNKSDKFEGMRSELDNAFNMTII